MVTFHPRCRCTPAAGNWILTTGRSPYRRLPPHPDRIAGL